jgi:hypothetical protein
MIPAMVVKMAMTSMTMKAEMASIIVVTKA